MKLPAISALARAVGLVLTLTTVLALAACGGDADTTGSTVPTGPATTAAETAATGAAGATEDADGGRIVTVYFADADAMELHEEERPAGSGSALRAALVELAEGPEGRGRIPALPAGTAIVGTDVRDGEALVNLSAEFVRGYPSGGAAAEFAVLAPLVYTATGVDGVERVRITVDGQTPAPAGSQYDWSGTFSRDDFPDVFGGSP